MKKAAFIAALIFVVIFSSACGLAGYESDLAPPPALQLAVHPVETSFGALNINTELLTRPAIPPVSKVDDKNDEAVIATEDTVDDTTPPEVAEELPEAEKPVVALTFDDGPSKEITPKLVELLEEYGVTATFCVVGNRLEKNMDIGTAIYESGSELVGHSWSHPYLTKLSVDGIKAQLNDTNALIEEITGSPSSFYRPPYGGVNKRVRSVSEELEMSLLMWSVDPQDWRTRDAESIYNHVLEYVTDGSIILCHDLYESTYEAMEMLIPELLEQGYRFVTVSELFEESDIKPGLSYTSK